MPEFLHDLRDTWRGWRRDPLYTAAVVGTLEVTLGASIAVFSIVNGVLLRRSGIRIRRPLVSIREVEVEIAEGDLRRGRLEHVHLRARLWQRDARLQACDDPVVELSHPVKTGERNLVRHGAPRPPAPWRAQAFEIGTHTWTDVGSVDER